MKINNFGPPKLIKESANDLRIRSRVSLQRILLHVDIITKDFAACRNFGSTRQICPEIPFETFFFFLKVHTKKNKNGVFLVAIYSKN